MERDFQNVISSPTAAYAEGLLFFRGEGMLNEVLEKLAQDLTKNEIDYAIVGAIALNQHGFQRFTSDIDVLMSRDGLERFRERLVGLGYRPAFEGARKKYRTSGTNIPVDIIVTGEFPGDGRPKPVAFPDPVKDTVEIDGIRTVTLEKLIELKLASGMTAPDRLKDLADVQELIKIKHLDDQFAMLLNDYVRPKFLELYQGVVDGSRFDNEN